jgi:2-alkyl-3-oxoalkanoate reductase
VDDAALATLTAVEADVTGVYNIADDVPAAVADWVPGLAEAVGAKPPRSVPRSSPGSSAAKLAYR